MDGPCARLVQDAAAAGSEAVSAQGTFVDEGPDWMLGRKERHFSLGRRMTMKRSVLLALAAVLLAPRGVLSAADLRLPRLKVSDNKRFFVTAEGQPFFWLGDTAWELFHRLNREEAVRYLENRAKKGFTVSRRWPSPSWMATAIRTRTAICRWSISIRPRLL